LGMICTPEVDSFYGARRNSLQHQRLGLWGDFPLVGFCPVIAYYCIRVFAACCT